MFEDKSEAREFAFDVADALSDGVELDMAHADLVERAIQAQEPVTGEREFGDRATIYSAAQYDPDADVCWRADITHDTSGDGAPRVGFRKCHPTTDIRSLRGWSPLATGRLSGPQHLPAWEALFTVFNAALIFYHQETDQ